MDPTQLIVVNAVCVWLIQWAKGSKLVPFLTHETQALNKIASVVIAGLASAGIVLGASHTGSVSQGTLSISWQGLTFANVANLVYHWIANYAAQKGMYKVFHGLGNGNGPAVLPPAAK